MALEIAQVEPGWDWDACGEGGLPQPSRWYKFPNAKAQLVQRCSTPLFCGTFSNSIVGLLKYKFDKQWAAGALAMSSPPLWKYMHVSNKHAVLMKPVNTYTLNITILDNVLQVTALSGRIMYQERIVDVRGTVRFQDFRDRAFQHCYHHGEFSRPSKTHWVFGTKILKGNCRLPPPAPPAPKPKPKPKAKPIPAGKHLWVQKAGLSTPMLV